MIAVLHSIAATHSRDYHQSGRQVEREGGDGSDDESMDDPGSSSSSASVARSSSSSSSSCSDSHSDRSTGCTLDRHSRIHAHRPLAARQHGGRARRRSRHDPQTNERRLKQRRARHVEIGAAPTHEHNTKTVRRRSHQRQLHSKRTQPHPRPETRCRVTPRRARKETPVEPSSIKRITDEQATSRQGQPHPTELTPGQ